MLDFVDIRTYSPKKGVIEVSPEFLVIKPKDVMIRGRSFYAIWDENEKMWSTDENKVQELVDRQLYLKAEELKQSCDERIVVKYLKNFSSKKWSEWLAYCKSSPDNYHELDTSIAFANTKQLKTNYISHKLEYDLVEQPTPAYDALTSVLYSKEELQKLEWAIGSIIFGDSKNIQKFIVLYGGPGTGKSTMINIIQMMFKDYYSVFESKALVSNSDSFALEAFKSNPLIAIQHDGNLSRIEDNTRLNSIVSHETLRVNEKFKPTYSSRFNSFIIMGTNSPVKITDAKSGIIRRLIDVTPTGNKIPVKTYNELYNQIKYELGGIAYHCLEVYKKLGKSYYNDYIPLSMMNATNNVFNFIEEEYEYFIESEDVPLNVAWTKYKGYCLDANIQYPLNKISFKEELKTYFKKFSERSNNRRNIYSGFKKEKFNVVTINNEDKSEQSWIILKEQPSKLDELMKDFPAQYATADGKPKKSWDSVKTTLKDLDTRKMHFINCPINYICIDLDIKDENGEKNLMMNLKKAAEFPKTYVEVSKSGQALHLYYIYVGDVEKLASSFGPDIEIKKFTGNASLRRKLTLCNDMEVATISSNLPLKESKNMVSDKTITDQQHLVALIKKGLDRKVFPNTKPSIDYISMILDKAYESGMVYDVEDLRGTIRNFALESTNNVDYCLKVVDNMKFKSDHDPDELESAKHVDEEKPIIIFDIETVPNLLLICWKEKGAGNERHKMFNPSPEDVKKLVENSRLVGYNNLDFDNHILWAAMMGYSTKDLSLLSQKIIKKEFKGFKEARNLSYTDVFDFLSPGNKMSLKKWEIKIKQIYDKLYSEGKITKEEYDIKTKSIKHHEMDIDWTKPLPEDQWEKLADYCLDDVEATEAVWDVNDADWEARLMLSKLSGLSPNCKTNTHTIQIITGGDKQPQSQYNYPDLAKEFEGYRFDKFGIDKDNYIPGTKIVSAKSFYRGVDPGEGGYVFAIPGYYEDAALLDVESMHPSTIIFLKLFGEEYTRRYELLKEGRLAIKHNNFERAKEILCELNPNIADEFEDIEKMSKNKKALSNALKAALNSAYGLTCAKFTNKLKDDRNIDNVVAKRGALFMINLKDEVEKRGFKIIHTKTDSIKIPNATTEIINFVKEYGLKYGYKFAHEATYKKMCLVNDSVYIAQYMDKDECMARYNYIPEDNEEHSGEWTATGAQFQVPYVFKKLFSKEQITFNDICETKSVTTKIYLDFNENLNEDEHNYIFVGKVGSFCPVKDGCDGGHLMRYNERTEKYDSVTGTKKGKELYRWMEAYEVEKLGDSWWRENVDFDYYDSLVTKAIEAISEYTDYIQFCDL